jgi:hypothetical protein
MSRQLIDVSVTEQLRQTQIRRRMSPFQAKRKLDFLDQPASRALGRDAIAIEKSDRLPDFFDRLERACARSAAFRVPHTKARRGRGEGGRKSIFVLRKQVIYVWWQAYLWLSYPS